MFGWLVGRGGRFGTGFGHAKEMGGASLEFERGVSFMKLGGVNFLLEFEDTKEAERVLKRGVCCFEDKVLHLERWGPKVGCFQLKEHAKQI